MKLSAFPPASFLLAALAIGLGALLAPDASAKDVTVPFDSYDPWSEEASDEFRHVLVQEGGRVKPVHTYSRFLLMQFSGRSKLEFETGDGTSHEIDAASWMMDTFFRPEISAELPLFIVDDSEAVLRLGIQPKEKRDRYSYADLLEGRAKLAELAREYAEKKQKHEESDEDPQYELDRIEGMVLVLGRNVSSFEYLMGQFGFARKGEALTHESMLPPELKELAQRLDMTEMLQSMPELSPQRLMQSIQAPPSGEPDAMLLRGAMQLFFFHANSGRGFAVFPPPEAGEAGNYEFDPEVWLSIGDVMFAGLEDKGVRVWSTERMAAIQTLVDAASPEGTEFAEAIRAFAAEQREEVNARDLQEGDRSALEVALYEGKFFTNSLVWFILSFLCLAFSWMAPGSKASKYLTWAVVGCLVLGLIYVIAGITMRSLIRHRPPITNLYDTVIFITAVAVVLGLILERFTRIGIGLLVASLIGVGGMFLSIKYEAKEATDTMGQLVAVLDTNFWLATHVTIINIGYAAGILAAVLGMVYLIGRTFGLKRGDKNFYRTLNGMNYGVICFCLVFSLVGTILGGIWANYSWGRFWGWDPKENGALMICLWTLVILHGRMGGYLREIGINVNAILLGIIVTFSWWGVNNLGVGLHSYGFTSGVWMWLGAFWLVCGAVMLLGLPLWLKERQERAEKKRDRRKKAGGGQSPAEGATPTTA